MSKKSARKAAPPPPPPARRFAPLHVAAIVALLAGLFVGAGFWLRSDRTAEAPSAAAVPVPAPSPAEAAAKASLGPHAQQVYPPLPLTGYAPVRPMPVVEQVYQFAAEHPEVLSYVPCYCGCERQGHHDNEDCFVAARDGNGDVTAWEPHGVT